MAYFNHAFRKMMLATGEDINVGGGTPTKPEAIEGVIRTADVPTSVISGLDPGYIGIVDPKTWKTFNPFNDCCPFVLVGSPLYTDDKIGPFHGGYRETNKSKIINPKYVQQVYTQPACTPSQAHVAVGSYPGNTNILATFTITNPGVGCTPGTYTDVKLDTAFATVEVDGAGNVVSVIITNPGYGFTVGQVISFNPTGCGTNAEITVESVANPCAKEYICDETYYLRIDVKGSPALRFLNHNAYQTVDYYTGCCSGTVPTAVDPTLVYIGWASRIVENPYLSPFVGPIVVDYTGKMWFAPGTTESPYDGNAVTEAEWWTNYPTSAEGTGWTNETTGGLILNGAYVDTKFGNCSFQVTDHFQKEPVKILASMVDYTGDPCTFDGVCVTEICPGFQGYGYGDQVLRDLILAESYLQNYFSNDIRIRELTQGDDILAAVDRNLLYDRGFILHSVPRFNNPTGVFDNDRYLIEIVAEAGLLSSVINDILDPLAKCAGCIINEGQVCGKCDKKGWKWLPGTPPQG